MILKGFTTAYYPSLECIKRFGVHVNEERMVHYPHPPAMREGLRNGEVIYDIIKCSKCEFWFNIYYL